MYTYKIDDVTVEAPLAAATANEVLLNAALGIAAQLSFMRNRPVAMHLQGQPYRVVSVTFAERPTRP